MRALFTCLMMLLLSLPGNLSAQGFDASSQTTKKSEKTIKDGVIRCARGVMLCTPLVGTPKEYEACMVKECTSQPTAQTWEAQAKIPVEQRNTCTQGQVRCIPLLNESTNYWECMSQTCAKAKDFPSSPCTQSTEACAESLDEYNNCIRTACPNQVRSAPICDKGTKDCKPLLNTYWQCVSTQCFGADPTTARNAVLDTMTYTLPSGRIIPRPRMNSVHPHWKHAPDGIDPLDWASSVPAWRRLRGNPMDQLQCLRPGGAYLHCQSNDLISCTCSDGSPAIPR